ncbi:unnamed protein product, partial [Laminaria digitata]
QVRFSYVVDPGDFSPNLTWAGPLSLGANGIGTRGSEDWILGRSTNPTTPANLSLPDSTYPLARGGSTIYVNTTGRPKVVNVTSPNAAGVYAPGDVIAVWVEFDRYVVVVGKPVLNLHTGNTEPGRATYSGGSGNQARELPKSLPE